MSSLDDIKLQCEEDYPPLNEKPRACFKTSDGKVFNIPEATVTLSTYLTKNLLRAKQAQKPDDCVKLPDISSTELESVLAFCFFCTSEYWTELSLDERAAWEDEFLGFDPVRLCELCNASYLLGVKRLLDLAVERVAKSIHGKTPQQLRELFSIDCEPEEQVTQVRARKRKHLVRCDFMANEQNTRKQKRKPVEAILRIRPPNTVDRTSLDSDNVEVRSSDSSEVQFVSATPAAAKQDDSHTTSNFCTKEELVFDDAETTKPSSILPMHQRSRPSERLSSYLSPQATFAEEEDLVPTPVRSAPVPPSPPAAVPPIAARVTGAPKTTTNSESKLPVDVRIELARIAERKKGHEQQAKKIEEEIQRLMNERERVRDELAFEKLQMNTIYRKYNIKPEDS